MDEKGLLTDITERTRIMHRPEGIAFTEDKGESWTVLPEDTLVSMNFWGFPGSMMDAIEAEDEEFIQEASDYFKSIGMEMSWFIKKCRRYVDYRKKYEHLYSTKAYQLGKQLLKPFKLIRH